MKLWQSILSKLAKWLNVSIQGEAEETGVNNDYDNKLSGLSIVDNVSQALVPSVWFDYKWQILGDSQRAKYLGKLANRFVETQLFKCIETSLNTGDVITIPIQTHGKIITQLVDNNSFTIIDCAGDELYEIQFIIDSYTENYTQYVLLEDIKYDIETNSNIFSLYISVDGTISTNLSLVDKWSDYDQTWTIPNTDRLLIGRMKCPATNPSNINNIKGVPLCSGAGQAVEALRSLYDQISNEFISSEKMIFADKSLFVIDRKTNSKGEVISSEPRLPKGKKRLYQTIDMGGTENEGLIKEYSPEIRISQYKDGKQIQEQLLEQSIGANSGILSESNTVYQNVDNVRKANQKTNSLIAMIRRSADSMMTDLIYAWNVLCNYYNLTVMGEYDEVHNWSDEYITTFDSKRQQLLDGVSIGAISIAEYRQWVTEETLEEAQRKVDEISENKIIDIID